MQVVSTTDAAASPRASAGRLARLDRPALAALIALAGWLVFAAARLAGWAHGQLSLFIASGTRYSHPALMFPRIAHVKGKGYDGQFYYRFAFDPFNWHVTAYGITIDHPYRYTRIGYSVVAWLLSGGGHGRLLPLALAGVNLAGVAAMAWLGGVLARQSGRHALWGLLFAAYFLPGCLPGPASDVEDVIAGSHAAGGAQHLVMAPQFGVVAGEAGALPVNGVRHERLPAVSPWAAAYAWRRSASSCGRLSAGACPPSISSGVMPRRSRATRRTNAGGSR